MRIVGKGDRERLIPLTDDAQRWIRDFIDGPRMEILLERQTDYLFPTRRGDRMTRQAFWAHHQAIRAQGGASTRSCHRTACAMLLRLTC